jgi:hypothetical protein
MWKTDGLAALRHEHSFYAEEADRITMRPAMRVGGLHREVRSISHPTPLREAGVHETRAFAADRYRGHRIE